MLIFIIPLKSQQVAKSWQFVCKLFSRCIQSVCNQTSDKFRVIVVCHEKPEIEFNHPYITYIKVDFSPPTSLDPDHLETDKGRKILKGLLYCHQFNPSHVMIVDADDCVSNRIVKFVSQHPQSHGFFINKGYKYNNLNNLIYFKRNNFYKMCGTCNIIRYDLLELPEGEYNRGYGYYKKLIEHAKMKENMAAQGTPLKPLPFAGAVYIIESGENIYFNNIENKFYQNKHWLYSDNLRAHLQEIVKIFNFRLLTPEIRNEFFLHQL